METEHLDGADHLRDDLERHRPRGHVSDELDHVIQHPRGVHPHLGIRIDLIPGGKLAGPGPRLGGAEQVSAVGDGGGDGAVAEREDEAGVPDAEPQREAEVERGRLHAEGVDAEAGDAGGGGRRVEEEGGAREEREEEEERERPRAEAAEAARRAARVQAAEPDQHRGAGRRDEDERWGRGRGGLRVGGRRVGVVGQLRGLRRRRREEGLAEVSARLLAVAGFRRGGHRRRGCGLAGESGGSVGLRKGNGNFRSGVGIFLQ